MNRITRRAASEWQTNSVVTLSGAFINGNVRLDSSGTFVGRDQIINTADQQYDVHGLANPYLGLQSFN